eukprot:582992-Hanusia_phi.AAC.10
MGKLTEAPGLTDRVRHSTKSSARRSKRSIRQTRLVFHNETITRGDRQSDNTALLHENISSRNERVETSRCSNPGHHNNSQLLGGERREGIF